MFTCVTRIHCHLMNLFQYGRDNRIGILDWLKKMSQILSQALTLTRFVTGQLMRSGLQFNALPSATNGSYQSTVIPNAWSMNAVREKTYTYRQNETKRVKKLGYWTRMKTRSGRMIIMRRILKGRFVLSH